MKVLVACEYSGIVRDAFSKLGHEAWSCDILPTESEGNHIQDDVLKHLDKGWDLMIAHPPCTYLSNAGARFLYPKGILNEERYKKGMIAKDFFMKLYNAPIKYICIENPISSKIFNLPKHSQTIQPYEFGHPYSKATRLWLKNLPELKATKNLKEYKPLLPSNTGGKKRNQSYHYTTINAKESSKTFKGIAEAMANQWNIQSTKIAGNWFNKGGKDRQKNRSKFFSGMAEAMANQWGKND
jgi:hypothetical protein